MIRRPTWAIFALLLLLASGCRWFRRRHPVVARHAPVVEAAADLFASHATPRPAVRITRWLDRRPLLAPFFTAVDGIVAAMAPDGEVRWAMAGPDGPVVHASMSPCRFDPSRHSMYWSIEQHIAVDGNGEGCCVNDGDATTPSGVYCADLTVAEPRWQRLALRAPVAGVGSGADAIAVFAHDVVCVRDGGRTLGPRWEGDSEQSVTAASCDVHGRAIAIAGTRSAGGLEQQTVRAAEPNGPLVAMEDVPRGNPLDARVLGDGSVVAVMATRTGVSIVWRAPGHAPTVRPVGVTALPSLGVWGRDRVLAGLGAQLSLFAAEGDRIGRTLDENQGRIAVASRVGHDLVAVTREAQFVVLSQD